MESRATSPALIVLAIVVALALAYTARMILLVALIGVGIGALLVPLVRWMRTRVRVPAGITAFLVIIVLLAVLGGVGYSIYFIAANQLGKVVDSLPRAYFTVRNWLSHHTGLIQGGSNELSLSAAVQKVVGTVFQGAKLGFEVGAGLFFVISIALYVAVSPDRNLSGFLTLFPAHSRSRIAELMRDSAETLRRWFVSQLIVVAAIGAAYALGLWLIGNPYWMLFGFLAAVLEFVPYVGPFTIAVGASAVALSNDQPMSVVWVCVLGLGIQELEGHLLIPLVMKDRINLPPVQLITLAVMMGVWFGILGVFVTPPLLAVLRNIYLATYAKSMNESQGSRRAA